MNYPFRLVSEVAVSQPSKDRSANLARTDRGVTFKIVRVCERLTRVGSGCFTLVSLLLAGDPTAAAHRKLAERPRRIDPLPFRSSSGPGLTDLPGDMHLGHETASMSECRPSRRNSATHWHAHESFARILVKVPRRPILPYQRLNARTRNAAICARVTGSAGQ